MFRVGDHVYHRTFGSGTVARTSGADCTVYFDNLDHNPLVPVEPPPTEKRKRRNAAGEEVEDIVTLGPSPLDGKVIHWDEPPQEKKGLAANIYKWPTRPGFFYIVKATQTMVAVFSKEEQKLKFHPSEDHVDIAMTNTETGEKFKVEVNGKKAGMVYTARKVTTDSLEGEMRDL